MLRNKKIASLLLALLMMLSLTASVLFVIFEADHDCSGDDDCRICQQIDVCLNFFKDISPDPNVAGFSFAVVFSAVLLLGVEILCKKNSTLVTLKVKLSN